MKPIQITLFLLICCNFSSLAQDSLNMYRMGVWDIDTLPWRAGGAYNDIWGYASGGREYAILGSIEKIHFIDVTNPANPVEIAAMGGGYPSIWRDFKTYSHYAYAVADEGSEGLRIFDLSNLPTSVSQIYQSTTWFDEAHNIYIDEGQGKLYVAGSDAPGIVDLQIFDLTADPEDPTLLANVNLPGNYIHDIHVVEDTAFVSHGNTGLYVYDMSTPTSPNLLNTLTSYPEEGYNHSSWLNKTKDYLVFCDETKDTGVKIMNVTDLSNLEVPNNQVFRSQLLAPFHTNSVAHNPFIENDTLYVAYYHDGLQVFDISNPSNVFRIGYYDTVPTNTNYNGWYGAWGVYPYLPSGNIIVSDILNGLQIINFGLLPVPAEMGRLNGEIIKAEVVLSWNTYSEENTYEFIVERSLDGRSYEEIGVLPAAGYSSIERQYNFIDEDPNPGLQYYRLKIRDWDEQFEYSELISVYFEHPNPQIKVYPTVVNTNDRLYIETESPIISELIIFSMDGRRVFSSEITGSKSIDLGTLQLPANNYLIHIKSPNFQHQQKLILTD